jgi:Flp pilus assembly protein TadG
MTARRLGGDHGSVVAEFAVAFPAIALVVLFGVGALAAGSKHVRLQDAAADAARTVSRGEPAGAAGRVVAAAVPGAAAAVDRQADLVCVTATAPSGIIAVTLAARSCALAGGL